MTSSPIQEELLRLYDSYSRKIHTLAYRMLGNRAEAEETTQDTFLRAIEHQDQFAGRSSVATWLFTIAKNLCLRALEKRRRSSFAQIAELVHIAEQTPNPADIAAWEKQHLVAQVKEGCLTGLLGCLPPGQRAAFVLHVLLDTPVREVAQILGKSEAATKVLVHRARQGLHGYLCQHCSLYDPDNVCRCDALLGFSLAKGWIQRPGQEVAPEQTEAHIEKARSVVALYQSLGSSAPKRELRERLRDMIEKGPART